MWCPGLGLEALVTHGTYPARTTLLVNMPLFRIMLSKNILGLIVPM